MTITTTTTINCEGCGAPTRKKVYASQMHTARGYCTKCMRPECKTCGTRTASAFVICRKCQADAKEHGFDCRNEAGADGWVAYITNPAEGKMINFTAIAEAPDGTTLSTGNHRCQRQALTVLDCHARRKGYDADTLTGHRLTRQLVG